MRRDVLKAVHFRYHYVKLLKYKPVTEHGCLVGRSEKKLIVGCRPDVGETDGSKRLLKGMRCMCLPCSSPLALVEPTNVVLIPKAADPVDAIDDERCPKRNMRRRFRAWCPMRRIGMMMKIARRQLLRQDWVCSGVGELKVTEECSPAFGRHPTAPVWSVVSPMCRVMLGMTFVRYAGIRIRSNAHRSIPGRACEHISPRLRPVSKTRRFSSVRIPNAWPHLHCQA